jgi:hypothetical protein
MDINFYWTTADTISALAAGGGSVIAMYLTQIMERVLARRSS